MTKKEQTTPKPEFPAATADLKAPEVVTAEPAKSTSPDFGKTIERAFKAPWKHKTLWFYGVILALFAGGSSFGSGYQGGGGSGNPDFGKAQEMFKTVPTSVWVLLGTMVAVIVIICLVLNLTVGNWALAAVIKSGTVIGDGGEPERKKISKESWGSIWGLIKLNFLIPFAVVLGVIALGAVIAGISIALAKPLGIIFAVIFGGLVLISLFAALFYFGVLWLMAIRFVVVENQGAIESIKSAQKLVKGNFWMTFLLSLVTGFIVGCGGCLGVILFIIFLVVTAILIIAKVYAVAVVFGILSLAGAVLMLIVAGYFRAFAETGYTFWWQDLKKL